MFDRDGGFWFTDLGKTRARDMDRGGVYYARTDGSMLKASQMNAERHAEDPLTWGDEAWASWSPESQVVLTQ